jgi:ParB family chromosome partitioning protein
METISSLITVPLKKLVLSSKNVRKSNRDEDIEGLAQSIQEHGLDQNLIVIPSDERGKYEVIAGGRRYLALRRLQAQRTIPATFDVPVKLIEPEDARAASLRENIERVAMNPADEILAFAEIVTDHADEADPIAYCARRIGRSRDVVAQRLRLAKLPARILDALRDGTIGLNAATAYASVADPEAQLQIFRGEEARAIGQKHRPDNVRDALKGRTLPASCPQARYVGIDAYVAAGGRTDRDLFMGADAGEQLLDPTLLNELAREKAEAELPACLAQDGFGSGAFTKNLIYPGGEMPKAPAGFTTAFIWADMPDDERKVAIGVYALSAATPESLMLMAVQKPVRPPAVGAARPIPIRPDPIDAAVAELKTRQAHQSAVAGEGRPGEALRAQALQRAAARIAAEHVIEEAVLGSAIDPEKIIFPIDASFLPPVTTAIGDDDTILVAVQIRVPRAELEAAIPEAEQQLEEAA